MLQRHNSFLIFSIFAKGYVPISVSGQKAVSSPSPQNRYIYITKTYLVVVDGISGVIVLLLSRVIDYWRLSALRE